MSKDLDAYIVGRIKPAKRRNMMGISYTIIHIGGKSQLRYQREFELCTENGLEIIHDFLFI